MDVSYGNLENALAFKYNFLLQDIEKAFFLLLLLVIIGEFFSAPAITLADSAVITLLGEDADRYGHQRMFGSLGWGLAMFFVGIALDHSTSFPDHPCGPDAKEKNYTICFATFSVLMGAALITATQITFKYDFPPESEANLEEKKAPQFTHEDAMQQQLAQQLNLPQLADTNSIPVPTKPPPPPPQLEVRYNLCSLLIGKLLLLYNNSRKEQKCARIHENPTRRAQKQSV